MKEDSRLTRIMKSTGMIPVRPLEDRTESDFKSNIPSTEQSENLAPRQREGYKLLYRIGYLPYLPGREYLKEPINWRLLFRGK